MFAQFLGYEICRIIIYIASSSYKIPARLSYTITSSLLEHSGKDRVVHIYTKITIGR